VRRGADSDEPSPSLVDAVKTAAENLVDLIGAQIRLARVEVVSEVGRAARRTLRLAIFIPMLLGGYACGVAALAAWLSGYCGLPGALGIVAGAQLLAGGIGLFSVQRRLRSVKLLERSSSEVTESIGQAVAAISSVPPEDQRKALDV
jgi:hypothetical protein